MGKTFGGLLAALAFAATILLTLVIALQMAAGDALPRRLALPDPVTRPAVAAATATLIPSLTPTRPAEPTIALATPTRPDPTAVPTTPPSPVPTRTRAVTATPPCLPRTDWAIYIVQSGDTLTRLANWYGVEVPELRAANCLPDNDIFAGQRLRVPPNRPPLPTRTPPPSPLPTRTSPPPTATFIPSPTATATVSPTPAATTTIEPTPTVTATVPAEPTRTPTPAATDDPAPSATPTSPANTATPTPPPSATPPPPTATTPPTATSPPPSATPPPYP